MKKGTYVNNKNEVETKSINKKQDTFYKERI